jgi:hypothetical protein
MIFPTGRSGRDHKLAVVAINEVPALGQRSLRRFPIHGQLAYRLILPLHLTRNDGEPRELRLHPRDLAVDQRLHTRSGLGRQIVGKPVARYHQIGHNAGLACLRCTEDKLSIDLSCRSSGQVIDMPCKVVISSPVSNIHRT